MSYAKEIGKILAEAALQLVEDDKSDKLAALRQQYGLKKASDLPPQPKKEMKTGSQLDRKKRPKAVKYPKAFLDSPCGICKKPRRECVC